MGFLLLGEIKKLLFVPIVMGNIIFFVTMILKHQWHLKTCLERYVLLVIVQLS